ncbi:Hypothetical predicted protein [Podarcis lilfordi]|uniref:Uncharacterized protein n=1 Tax=Podarcis lilfordi TaxID=74358 RepID=A0AA35K3Q1_9SAUR|nr:Hypothetical predicted protein [Podarcis lilfordi]
MRLYNFPISLAVKTKKYTEVAFEVVYLTARLESDFLPKPAKRNHSAKIVKYLLQGGIALGSSMALKLRSRCRRSDRLPQALAQDTLLGEEVQERPGRTGGPFSPTPSSWRAALRAAAGS